jgi:hypothetical protein
MGAFGEPPTHEIDDAPIPDYCNNLNAMHDAEKTLSHDQMLRYHGTLLSMCERSMYASTAPADQRAAAFIKTIDLPKDEIVNTYMNAR